ncbi:hypothetical protein ACFW04_006590 [Cataglyphis niger]
MHIANKARKFTEVVRPEIFLLLLSKFELPQKIIKFINVLISHRHLIGFAAGINLQNRYTTIGLPQGSTLSPILFNLYIALSFSVIPNNVNILYYTDDIVIYCSDHQLELIKHQLNTTLKNLHQFLNSHVWYRIQKIISHHRTFQIRKSLFECSRKLLEMHIFWISSHKGIPATFLLSNPFLFSKCHYTNLYFKFKILTKNKAHIHNILSPPWYSNIKEDFPRTIITFISRIRIYHTTKGHIWEKKYLQHI